MSTLNNRDKLLDIPICEIEEYLKEIMQDEETDNLFVRCLGCGDYIHISKINIDEEKCEDCEWDSEGDDSDAE